MFKYSIVILFAFWACKCGKVKTPKEFINNVKIDPALYRKDSIAILEDLYSKMLKHEASFVNPEYFDSTKLYIDTILYDSTFNKAALFVIAENATTRNPYSFSKLPFYYNASCYLGKRLADDSSFFELKNIGPVSSVVNFDDRKSISHAIRDIFFSELTTSLDADSNPFWDFNINDKRFWTSSKGWQRVFP